MVSLTEATLSLTVEIVVLALLITAYMFKRQNKYRRHGMLMLSAVVLHLITILSVMIFSFGSFFLSNPSAVNFADILVILTLVHVFAGLIAALLGVWLVGSWHLQKDLQPCFRKKRVMDVTLTLWLLAIFLGIILYWRIWIP